MDARLSIVTLGVTDLERSTRFYRDGLGFPVHEAGSDSITFFMLNGVMLALFPRNALAEDASPMQGGDREQESYQFTLAHNVASREEVDAVLAEAGAAGARIIKPASETFWGGYSGYFADPDGFQWEIATGSGLPIEPVAK